MILSSVQYFQIDTFRMKFVPCVFVHEMVAKRSVCCSVNRVASVLVVPQADWAHGLPYIKCIPPLLLTYPTANFIHYVLLRAIPFEIGHTQVTFASPWTTGLTKGRPNKSSF